MSDELDFGLDGFKSFADRIKNEREERVGLSKRILTFGVHFLDVALGGIFPNDLIILGAKTGAGKTALASRIAVANALNGKRVHYFALEAEQNEIERRYKFMALSDQIRILDGPAYVRMNYLDWYAGKLEDICARHERRVSEFLANNLKTLFTYYRTSDFYAENFERMTLAIQDQTDLVILDHLHYVDSEDPNENRGYKLIVKKVRDVALSCGKPVIVVAHVRKGDRRNPQLVPTLEDFHGTSDVPKIATKAVMLAPAFDQPSEKSYLWPTYITPAKCRFDGTRTRYTGLVTFDVRSGNYDDFFDLGMLKSGGTEWESCDNDKLPVWAKQKI